MTILQYHKLVKLHIDVGEYRGYEKDTQCLRNVMNAKRVHLKQKSRRDNLKEIFSYRCVWKLAAMQIIHSVVEVS